MRVKKVGHLVVIQDELGEVKIDLLEAQKLLKILEEICDEGSGGGSER